MKFPDAPKFRDDVRPTLEDFRPYSLAWVIERYIREMNGYDGKPPVRELGDSHEYILRSLQLDPIGAKMAPKLSKLDVIEHCKRRRAELTPQGTPVKPQTVQQDVTYLRGVLKYAGSAWDDCEDISDKAIKKALPFLTAHQLIAKGSPRDRRPLPAELAAIEVLAAESNTHKQSRIDMVKFSRWQVASGRRVSESCRIEWLEWDYETQTVVVHKMKDPKNRNKTKRVALTEEAQGMLLDLALEMDANPATWTNQERRIWPYVAKSAGAKYTRLKKKAGIVDLHLHDSRAECYTSMREKGIPGAIAILVTGHETEALPERVYKRMKAESFKTLQHVREAA